MGRAVNESAPKGGGRIRRRLLLAFLLVALPPLVLLGVAATALILERSERTTRTRFEVGLRRVRTVIGARRLRAEQQVAAVARDDLPTRRPDEGQDRTIAEAVATARDLPVLVLLDAQDRVISSSHWPAGFNLPDRGTPLPGDPVFRIETVAEGYGDAQRLALTAQSPAVWRGAPVTVRGGSFLDREFLDEISELMDLDVALRSSAPGRWFARPESPIQEWNELVLTGPAPGGSVTLSGVSYRWAAAPLSPSLWLVLSAPGTEAEQVARDVRRTALALAGVAMIGAFVAAFASSGRIARPVRELADAARRVSAGDLSGTSVPSPPGADEIGDLARAFDTMTRDLRASRERVLQAERVAAWREMAQRLAHELKNPLFPIQLSIETLRRAFDQERLDTKPKGTSGGAEPDSSPPVGVCWSCGDKLGQSEAGGAGGVRRSTPPKRNDAFAALFRDSSDTILQELQSLKGIIEEFSQFARMPPPRLRPTDVNEVVDQVLGLYRARAAEVGVTIDVARASGGQVPLVPADPDLLARALGNLVANALEAMPQGGTLRLTSAASAGSVSLAVEDNGPGLTDEQRTRLFTPHFTTKKGGTGLGLAIVQGIVSDHGGRIEVDSPRRDTAGTCFTLVLPTTGPPPVREKLAAMDTPSA